MTTGLGIVTKALQKNGVLVKSETPSSDEANDGLDALNGMVSSWANDGMLIFARTYENFSLVAGTSEYTIGTGQTFNTTRPMMIVQGYVRSGTLDRALSPITDEKYAQIAYKSTLGTPEFINYDNAYPYAKIKLYPSPDINYTLYLISEKEISSFTLAGTIDLPPGWEDALIYNLAMRLAPDYGEAVDQTALALTDRIAKETKGAIKTAIMRNRSMDALPTSTNGYNIYTGYN